MKTIVDRRDMEDMISVSKYPKAHSKGIKDGEKIYSKGFPRKYIHAVMDRSWTKYESHIESNAYIVGLFEGYKEEELNDISING